MAFYCAVCETEIPSGKEVYAGDGRPRHANCAEPEAVAGGEPVRLVGTRVRCTDGRLVCQRLGTGGTVAGWLELPESLKQPLMAMVAEVARGKRTSGDYPVPGGDRLVVSRVEAHGSLGAVHLERRPVGFPPQGRDLLVDAGDVDLFLAQCRAV